MHYLNFLESEKKNEEDLSLANHSFRSSFMILLLCTRQNGSMRLSGNQKFDVRLLPAESLAQL